MAETVNLGPPRQGLGRLAPTNRTADSGSGAQAAWVMLYKPLSRNGLCQWPTKHPPKRFSRTAACRVPWCYRGATARNETTCSKPRASGTLVAVGRPVNLGTGTGEGDAGELPYAGPLTVVRAGKLAYYILHFRILVAMKHWL